jgi:nicotinate-nucleotide--dimethylbenzimidazole phosphoribosyltransferase
MGIGNTTTSSAVASVLLDRPVREMTGRGAGLSDTGLRRKVWAIETALEKNRPNPGDPLDVLAKVGGFDIAGMCGIFLGGAIYRVPVLMDGFISTAAALCAVRLCPGAKKAVFASHVSAEPAGRLILDKVGKKPLITAEMRLGEGAGAVALMPMLDMALALYSEGTTFDGTGIEAYTPQGE